MENIYVLNGDGQFINTISRKRAICLVVKGKVEILQDDWSIFKSDMTSMIRFMLDRLNAGKNIMLKLVKIIRMIYKNKVAYSKRNVFIRDDYKCTYCGEDFNGSNTKKINGALVCLTVDHVIPKSRGGKSEFENTVACCKACNNRKGSYLPSEVKMYPRRKPTAPTVNEYLMKVHKKFNFVM